jgi:hypothetical protein
MAPSRFARRGGLRRCLDCGCQDYHHRRNVYRDSGIYVAGQVSRGPIVARRLGRCWFAGCPARGRGGCRGWKRAPRPAA